MLASVVRTQTVQTLILSGPSGLTQILGPNPARLYVEFWRGPSAFTYRPVVPAPVPAGYASNAAQLEPQIYKFRDCPSVVTGAWFSLMQFGDDFRIVECIALPG